MDFSKLRKVLAGVNDERVSTVTDSLIASLDRLIEIGLPYLNMSRESVTLSGGESQRLKLVRYMGSSLTGMTYIFDEPSTGMHPRDVYRMSRLLKSLRDKGNTVIIIEHNTDVMKLADYIIDVGPDGGKAGGEIVFCGTPAQMIKSAKTITAEYLRK
jgi:excinuclease UvrABC ATPase subunit